MVKQLEQRPDNSKDDINALVLLTDPDGNPGVVTANYERPGEVVMTLPPHAEAAANANDIPLATAEMDAATR